MDPDKKGQWWLSGNITPAMANVVEVPGTIDREALEAQKLLNLAAAQRMNTASRKALFCIIMSGEDYIDAFERILRLDLQGNQVCILCYFKHIQCRLHYPLPYNCIEEHTLC